MLTGNSLWQIIRQTDAMSQGVMLLLLLMSIACWAIFFCKAMLFYFKQRDLQRALAAMHAVHTMEAAAHLATQYHKTLPGYFLTQGLYLVRMHQSTMNKSKQIAGDQLLYQLDQLAAQTIEYEETYLPFLASSAAVSPLLGLFGTVWGLIHAFIGISETQVADIAAVAPGIAEALTTTLAGLIVAIPALVMVNYLLVQVRGIENKLNKLADHIVRIDQATLQSEGELCADFNVAQKELLR